MPPIVAKMLPQAIVLVVALFWAWPALTTPAPKAVDTTAAQPKKPAVGQGDFTASMLSPTFRAPSKRDPFFRAGEHHSAKRKSEKSNGLAKAKIGKSMEFKDFGLVLSATCSVGDNRMALINGRIYKEKEAVERTPGESTGCTISSIQPHRVIVMWNGIPHQLNYSDVDMAAAKKASESASGANGSVPSGK